MACSCLCRLFSCCHRRANADESGTSTGHVPSAHRRQVEQSFLELWRDKGEQGEWKKMLFPRLRILVIGKTGAGKTTLIRHMVGKDGPDTIAEHVCGVQDINKEFLFSQEEGGLPFLIHDSNGLDFNGDKPVQEIKEFLKKHQTEDDFSDHVHIVWYVIQVTDNRSLENGGLMKLIREFKIPMLLILTFNEANLPVVTDDSIDMLLEQYSSVWEERKVVKSRTIRLKNGGITGQKADGTIIRDEEKRDVEGLKLVSKRTEELIDKRLKYTWIAAQAVDVEAKLELSAGLIAGYARTTLLTSLTGVFPFADSVKVGIYFSTMFVAMCRIWVVPEKLNDALMETFVLREVGTHVFRSVGREILYAAGMSVLIGTGVAITDSCPLEVILQALSSAGVFAVSKSVPVLVRTFSLQVLATILYVKCVQVGSSTCRWKPDVSKDEYAKLCEELVQDEKYLALLNNFARDDHRRNNALNKRQAKDMIKNRLLEIHHHLLRYRPTSLLAQLRTHIDQPGQSDDEDNELDDIQLPSGESESVVE